MSLLVSGFFPIGMSDISCYLRDLGDDVGSAVLNYAVMFIWSVLELICLLHKKNKCRTIMNASICSVYKLIGVNLKVSAENKSRNYGMSLLLY